MEQQAYLTRIPQAVEQMAKGAFLLAGGSIANPMTIGWAQFGWVWGKPVVTVMVRKSRFTYELMEKEQTFAVCVPALGQMGKEIGYCGAHSGREGNKAEKAGLTIMPAQSYPGSVVEGCVSYFECRKVFRAESDLSMLDADIKAKFYGSNQAGTDGDPHVLYFGEVTAVYGA